MIPRSRQDRRKPADRASRARAGPVPRVPAATHRQGEHRRGGVLVAAPALGQGRAAARASRRSAPARSAGNSRAPVLLPALGHLAFQHVGGPAGGRAGIPRSVSARNDHRRDLVQRGHGGRTDHRWSARGPAPPTTSPLAADGEDLLLSAIGVPDADLDPARVDDHHLGCVLRPRGTAPPRRGSTPPPRRPASAARLGGRPARFQKLRTVGRSQRTLPAATGISAT